VIPAPVSEAKKERGPEALPQVLVSVTGLFARFNNPQGDTESQAAEGGVTQQGGLGMQINFQHDVEQVLKDAKAQQKPALLDFSAAPM